MLATWRVQAKRLAMVVSVASSVVEVPEVMVALGSTVAEPASAVICDQFLQAEDFHFALHDLPGQRHVCARCRRCASRTAAWLWMSRSPWP